MRADGLVSQRYPSHGLAKVTPLELAMLRVLRAELLGKYSARCTLLGVSISERELTGAWAVLVFSAYAPYSTMAIDCEELVLVAQLRNHSCTEDNVN